MGTSSCKRDIRIAFLGTPDFALPSLSMLLSEGYTVAGVFTQPDRPRNRGQKLLPPPVKTLAEQKGIPVFQYEKISKEGLSALRELQPDLMVTVAFGQILSRDILAVPRLGCINVHGSLLPKYRGAAPIEWAVMNGEKRTGVTTMFTVYELDAGDMLEKDSLEIGENETAGELRERLAELGAGTLKRTLEKLLDGTLVRTPQNPEEASYYPMFPRDFGQVDFSRPCQEIINLIRGLNPAPSAYMMLGKEKVKLFAAEKRDGTVLQPAGKIVTADPRNGLSIQTGDGLLEIKRLQFPGKKQMDAREFLRGNTSVFGSRNFVNGKEN